MPAATADLATTWAFLEDGVDHIMTKLQTGVSFSKVKHIPQTLHGPDPLIRT
jgi:cullin 1